MSSTWESGTGSGTRRKVRQRAFGGVVAFVLAQRSWLGVHALVGAETLPVAELAELHHTVVGVAGLGGFRRVCEMVGAAEPCPAGCSSLSCPARNAWASHFSASLFTAGEGEHNPADHHASPGARAVGPCAPSVPRNSARALRVAISSTPSTSAIPAARPRAAPQPPATLLPAATLTTRHGGQTHGVSRSITCSTRPTRSRGPGPGSATLSPQARPGPIDARGVDTYRVLKRCLTMTGAKMTVPPSRLPGVSAAVAQRVACPTCGQAAGKIPVNLFLCTMGHEFEWRACPASNCGALSIREPSGSWLCVQRSGRHE